MTPTLSLLICSLPSRLKDFEVIGELTKQAEGKPVEILYLGDNKTRTVGEKRNILLNLARGVYVAFVDDDDRVTPDYIDTLLEATRTGKDCITFWASVSINGGHRKICKYGFEYSHSHDHRFYYRKPNHLMAWKREVALLYPFPEINNGEDTKWAEQMAELQITEHKIKRTVYYYDFNSNVTEAQRCTKPAQR